MFFIWIRLKDSDPNDMDTSRMGLSSCFTCLINRIKICLWKKWSKFSQYIQPVQL
jgi:hypothetical protein